MKNETRRITEGAMMIAIIGAVSLIDRQMAGTLASNILFLFPLPLLMYSAR
ncbi:MAG: hypothetical protein IJ875_02170 [Solobacterium sp.]|nr:hypothetical protein [Solobacterium sp.]